ncbi:threonine/serine exporter family protein [Bacillus carboniphilus]|uniref:Threonine/serine exporter family protein n=1 Tax=Bacillus carboniphilus TaxID=86663 RepID=A0ABY9JUL7_9BACI|nr:threonine/serine exporter family protein [Bacillus carboniphilus]WLR42428.1 threonine/serine exporter family protein [Bacillus carboniphilus]
MNEIKTYDIMDICLLAGKIMLVSGAETYRVEDTMTRIAISYGAHNSHSFVTPTGIMLSIEGNEPTKTKLVRISERTTNLKKVTLVNSISRKIVAREIPLSEAYQQLKDIEKEHHTYPLYQQILAAAFASGCFTIMFKGSFIDFLPSLICGGVGFYCLVLFHRLLSIKFFAEFTASVAIGILSYLLIMIGIGDHMDKVIIGSVMPLVPGLLITNAVRDLIAGHLVSGLSKGAEAFLTAFAIGSGVAVAISLL